jgi:hypothetical protein
MSGLHDYRAGRALAAQGHSFYALIQAAMRQADSPNAAKLRAAWPEEMAELQARYDRTGGLLEGETDPSVLKIPEEDE